MALAVKLATVGFRLYGDAGSNLGCGRAKPMRFLVSAGTLLRERNPGRKVFDTPFFGCYPCANLADSRVFTTLIQMA